MRVHYPDVHLEGRAKHQQWNSCILTKPTGRVVFMISVRTTPAISCLRILPTGIALLPRRDTTQRHLHGPLP